MKVAIVHDWLTGMRGGEYVLEAIIELFPQADLFTLVYQEGSVSKEITKLPIRTSLLQKIPFGKKKYRHFLPLLPWMVKSLDVRDYDLILSSSHCVAKGIRKRPDAIHLSYVHAPMRYVWDRFDDYFTGEAASPSVKLAARVVRKPLQIWDRRTSSEERVDGFIANSRFISEQIRKAYGREASVVYPFADISRFGNPRDPQDFFLIVSAFAPYKRIDLAIEAFNRMKRKLVIVGKGQEEDRLRGLAGPSIEFRGAISNEEIARLYSQCQALIFPGTEDFGITPVEAMAAGAPVIAFNSGGAKETLTPETGVFFGEQTPEALIEAIRQFEGRDWSEEPARQRASLFTKERFQREFKDIVLDYAKLTF